MKPTPSPSPRKSRVSRIRQPEHLSLEEWQRALRRQHGAAQTFRLENLGEQPFLSDFRVTNPDSRSTYRVAIRGIEPGPNYCSCADFTTNLLGTCKHIEFTLARLSVKRGSKKAFRQPWDPPYSSVSVHYGAERFIRFRAGSEAPASLLRTASRYFDASGRLTDDGFTRFDQFIEEAARIAADLRVYDDAAEMIASVRDAAERQAIIHKHFRHGIRSRTFNSLLRVPLYDYQKEGALFAARAGRCLIGDEMGLGKTIQSIAAAEILIRYLSVERILVICPASLKQQWESEIASFSHRSAVVVGGTRAERRALFAGDSIFKITNYDTVSRDLDLIASWSPDLVILDEAQRIKNWNTIAAKAVKRIRSPYAIVLTGTPLENRLEELVSIVDFVDQHRLGPTFRFLDRHQDRDETGRVTGYRALDTIAETLSPIVLRRRKREVLKQLPERVEKHLFVPMTEEQLRHHDENRDVVARIAARWRKYGFLSESDQRKMTIALQRMRMSCDSSYLLDPSSDHGNKTDEIVTLLEELLAEPEAKVVIFSQWLRMHELIGIRLGEQGWGHVVFSGDVPTAARKGLIQRFRTDPECRVFLSTDAGGVGLNLQHASAVINVDLPWNPAVLEQRIGRVHRLGQRGTVQVINLVAAGTIEEGMLSILRFKKSLFRGILDGGESSVALGGTRLKRFMESVEKVTAAIPSPPQTDPHLPPAVHATAAVARTDSRETSDAGSPIASATDSAQTRVWSSPGARGEAAGQSPLNDLLATGLTFLRQLESALPEEESRPAGRRAAPSIDLDPATGEPVLRLPLPRRSSLARLISALGEILEE
jgi:superfamily II DNA or RNA helicase